MHQIGVGVLGPVFRTYDPDGDRLVAVKAFDIDLTPESAERLAEVLGRLVDAGLSHRAVVTPLAAGLEAGIPYLAQEYVAAESLDVAMRHYAPVLPERALLFVRQLASAVDAAHERGVLHGGLHLRDVFVTPDEARATGFGVARALEEVGRRAPVRRPYSAPELVAGRGWGAEADRFAVAAVAYELLTGKRAAGSGEQVIERLDGVDVGDHGDHLALSETFAGALADDPASRPSTAAEFVMALGEAVGVAADEASPVAVESDAHAVEDSAHIADLLEHIGPTSASEGGAGVSREVKGAPAGELTTDLAALDRTLDRLDPLPDPTFDGGLEMPAAPVAAFDASTPGAPPVDPGEDSVDTAEVVDDDPSATDTVDTGAAAATRSESQIERDLVPVDELRELRLPLAGGPDGSATATRPSRHDAVTLGADPLGLAAESVEPETTGRSVVAPATVITELSRLGAEAGLSHDDFHDDDDARDQPAVPTPDRSPDLLSPIDSSDQFDPLDPLSFDEPPPSRTLVRAMVPFALAAGVGVLVAYLAAIGFGIELPFGGSGVAPPAGGSVGGSEPAIGERDWSEATVGGEAAESTAVDSRLSPVTPAPTPVPPVETDIQPERGRRESPPPPAAVTLRDPPPPAQARARAANTPALGWLLVRTTPPGASVLVDGVDRGRTPMSLRDVAYGAHRVEIIASGYERQTREMTLSAATTVAAISVELSPNAGSPPTAQWRGSVFVDSRPAGARVLVNDAAVGLTPVLVPDLAPGTHRLRIEREGYQPWVTTVDVPPADRVRVSASLDPAER